MRGIISKTIEIKASKMPPCVDFIEQEIKAQTDRKNIVRWAIVDVDGDVLKICASVY